MTRTLGRLGLALALALALGSTGAVLLAHQAAVAAPPAIEQVAPSMLELPEDRLLRAPMPDMAPAPGTLIAGTRIRIPRLGIELPVELGDSARDVSLQVTPTAAAYLLPGSAVPGTRGNAYVYAHAREGLFLALWQTRLGDEIVISAPATPPLRYVVTEIHPRVDPGDLRYITPTEDERLTLQTSTGPWTLSPRFVVVARPLP